jgi:hypothetical protein
MNSGDGTLTKFTTGAIIKGVNFKPCKKSCLALYRDVLSVRCEVGFYNAGVHVKHIVII